MTKSDNHECHKFCGTCGEKLNINEIRKLQRALVMVTDANSNYAMGLTEENEDFVIGVIESILKG